MGSGGLRGKFKSLSIQLLDFYREDRLYEDAFGLGARAVEVERLVRLSIQEKSKAVTRALMDRYFDSNKSPFTSLLLP